MALRLKGLASTHRMRDGGLQMTKTEVLANLERVEVKQNSSGSQSYRIDGKRCSTQVASLIVDNRVDRSAKGELTRRPPHFSVPDFGRAASCLDKFAA